jgi:hypothetical protein
MKLLKIWFMKGETLIKIIIPAKVDASFEAKTKGLKWFSEIRTKEKWGTMQNVLSSRAQNGEGGNWYYLLKRRTKRHKDTDNFHGGRTHKTPKSW